MATPQEPEPDWVRVRASGKINLALRVGGLHSSGYHPLATVFQSVSLFDEVSVRWAEPNRFTVSVVGEQADQVPCDDRNLAVKAARLLAQHYGPARLGADIVIRKTIPVAGGMAGGSADAAGALLACSVLWDLDTAPDELRTFGAALGADVPFFIHRGHGWVEGIGEQIGPLALPPARFLVVKPPQGLDTGAIFGAPDLKRDTEPATIAGFAADPYGFGHNDLQPVAERLCPQVSEALQWLTQRGLHGRMTGSGSAVFAQVPQAQVSTLATALKAPADWQVRLCSNLEHHPLVGWVPRDD